MRRVMKPYGARCEHGNLILEFAEPWDGTPCLKQFPLHVRRALLSEPQIKSSIHLEAVLTSAHVGGDVFLAVKDDVECLIATRLVLERFPMDPVAKDAAMTFHDFAGASASPLDEILESATFEPLAVDDEENEEEAAP